MNLHQQVLLDNWQQPFYHPKDNHTDYCRSLSNSFSLTQLLINCCCVAAPKEKKDSQKGKGNVHHHHQSLTKTPHKGNSRRLRNSTSKFQPDFFVPVSRSRNGFATATVWWSTEEPTGKGKIDLKSDVCGDKGNLI